MSLQIPFERHWLLAHCQLELTTHSTATACTAIATGTADATAAGTATTALASNMLSVGGKVREPLDPKLTPDCCSISLDFVCSSGWVSATLATCGTRTMDRLCEHMVGGLFLGLCRHSWPAFVYMYVDMYIDIYLTHFIHMQAVFSFASLHCRFFLVCFCSSLFERSSHWGSRSLNSATTKSPSSLGVFMCAENAYIYMYICIYIAIYMWINVWFIAARAIALDCVPNTKYVQKQTPQRGYIAYRSQNSGCKAEEGGWRCKSAGKSTDAFSAQCSWSICSHDPDRGQNSSDLRSLCTFLSSFLHFFD